MRPAPYRLHARLKNNRLWTAILQQWPDVRSQADAAKRLKIRPTDIGPLLNMTRWPYSRRDGQWHALALKVAVALCEQPEYLFDPTLYGQPAKPVVLEVDRPALQAAGLLPAHMTPEQAMITQESQDALRDALATLPDREAKVLRMRFGLDDGNEQTLGQIGEALDLTAERVRQIEVKGLRHLRYPTGRIWAARKLRDLVEEG